MPGSIQPTTNNNNNANTARAGGGGVLEPEQMQVLEDIAARLDSPLLEAFFDQVLDECGPASPQPLQQLPALPAGDAHGQQPMQQGV